MLADFFTKPLKGEMFFYLRDIIMGYISMLEILENFIFRCLSVLENVTKNN